ncbi:MAG TPA: NUDIX hydrolase [Acidimicrobiales bacterium]|nr:NUDIX hydrolase [Acidimicrobiales bacterium]
MIYGAGTFLFDGDGRLLLIKEDYGERRFSLPGGQVDAGESPIEAALREAREEIGCEIRVTGVVGVALIRWTDLSVTAFAGEITSGTPHVASPGEIAEALTRRRVVSAGWSSSRTSRRTEEKAARNTNRCSI